jgi:aspartate racemase
MEGPAYPPAFAAAGVALKVPPPPDRDLIDAIIFEELCLGRVTEASRATLVRIITDLAAEGCDAVALSCTELPLAVTPDVSPLPTLDSTRLLAREAVAVAIGQRALPTWWGGPPSREGEAGEAPPDAVEGTVTTCPAPGVP